MGDNILRYTFAAIGVVGLVIVDTIITASLTYLFTKNYYKHCGYGTQAVAAAQASADNLKRGYRFLERRLEATQESLMVANVRLSGLESQAASVASMSSRRPSRTYPSPAYPTRTATPESTESQKAQAKIEKIKSDWELGTAADSNDDPYQRTKAEFGLP